MWADAMLRRNTRLSPGLVRSKAEIAVLPAGLKRASSLQPRPHPIADGPRSGTTTNGGNKPDAPRAV